MELFRILKEDQNKAVQLTGPASGTVRQSDVENDRRRQQENVFQSKCLRRIYKVHWPYIISNDELLKRTDTETE